MATALPFVLTGQVGQRLHGGSFPGGRLAGTALMASMVAAGGLALNDSALAGGAAMAGMQASGGIEGEESFGAGAGGGPVVGDVWTPARNGAGLVTAASYAQVPPNRWVTVAGTRMDALDSVVKDNVLGWQDLGNSDWVGVTHGWSGLAFDPPRGRVWSVCNGGHNDSSNDGIYRFDVYRMAFAVELYPSDITPWDTDYRNACSNASSTFCGKSWTDETLPRITAGTLGYANDWNYDELWWKNPANGGPGVGRPTPRHTYNGLLYSHETQELLMPVRRFWRYSLVSQTWTHKRQFGDDFSKQMGENMIATKMIDSPLVLIGGKGEGGVPYGQTFNLNTSSWTGLVPAWNWWDYMGAAACEHDDVMVVVMVPQKVTVNEWDARLGRYLVFNRRTGAYDASGLLQFGPGLDRNYFPDQDDGYDGAGIVYVPPLNRYWLLSQVQTGGLEWFEIDPTTSGGWTMNKMTPAGNVPVFHQEAGKGPHTLVNRRMGWMPGMNGIVFFGSGNRDISIYKFGEA